MSSLHVESDAPNEEESRRTNSLDTSKCSQYSSVAQQQQATEIVKALFGNVGKVVGVFSCSVARQSGRLYVSTEGLLFYSNLFGFEKKISIRFCDARELMLYRSTSIFIRTVNGDEHVLKSFQDRESVYKLISGYCPCTQMYPTDEPSVLDRSNESERRDSSQTFEECDLLDEPKPRLRTTSEESEVESADDFQSEPPKEDKSAIWDAIKSLSKDWDSSITSMKLQLDKVDDFFDLFLADKAPHSLIIYHQKIIGDRNVTIDEWSREDANEGAAKSDESFSRTVRFEHKSKVSVAQVTRNQTYRRYGESACMKNVTHISGVPSADAFFVEDFWAIEKCPEDGFIILNIKFRITFCKSTFLKSIIESRAKQVLIYLCIASCCCSMISLTSFIPRQIMCRFEALEWYSRYSSFLKDAIDGTSVGTNAQDISPASKSVPSETFINSHDKSTQLLLIFCVIVFLLYVYSIRLRVAKLENIIADMQSRMLEVENQCLLGT